MMEPIARLSNDIVRTSNGGSDLLVSDFQEGMLLRFGPFQLELPSGDLRNANVLLRLQPQPCKLLALLTRRAGQVVSREEIRQQIWTSSTFVDFNKGINFCIRKIRAALGENANMPRYIETLPRRGYRFIATVQPAKQAQAIGHKANESYREIALAVLPFASLDDRDSQEYSADVITELLITRLAAFDGLRVISRSSVMPYKKSRLPATEIARKLRVDAVVEGSVLRSERRVRVTVQLSDGRTGQNYWAGSYERELRDALPTQGELARTIVGKIRVALRRQDQLHSGDLQPVEQGAYQAYLKGFHCLNQRTDFSLKKAAKYFSNAIKRDWHFARAYAALADSYTMLGCWGSLAPQEAHAKARAAALRSVHLDGLLAEAHAALAYSRMIADWEWGTAEDGFRRAIELDPCCATAHQWYADYLTAVGRHSEAIVEIKRAWTLDPHSLIVNSDVGWTFHFAREYDLAIEQYQKTLEIDPSFLPARYWLGISYTQKSMFKDAIQELRKAVSLSEGNPTILAALGHAYACSGRKRDAQTILDKVRKLSKHKYISSYEIALVYAALGKAADAIGWLKKAVAERCSGITYLRTDPRLSILRTHPRFQALIDYVAPAA